MPKRGLAALSAAFAAGVAGALVNSAAAWAAGATGLTAACGVALRPALTPVWLYRRLVWGGLWGLLFLVPPPPKRAVRRGLVLSLLPTLVTLFVVFPAKGKGLLGLELGSLTPLFPLLLNALWGAAAGAWWAAARPGARRSSPLREQEAAVAGED